MATITISMGHWAKGKSLWGITFLWKLERRTWWSYAMSIGLGVLWKGTLSPSHLYLTHILLLVLSWDRALVEHNCSWLPGIARPPIDRWSLYKTRERTARIHRYWGGIILSATLDATFKRMPRAIEPSNFNTVFFPFRAILITKPHKAVYLDRRQSILRKHYPIVKNY